MNRLEGRLGESKTHLAAPPHLLPAEDEVPQRFLGSLLLNPSQALSATRAAALMAPGLPEHVKAISFPVTVI